MLEDLNLDSWGDEIKKLTPENEAKIEEVWNNSVFPPTITELRKQVFGDNVTPKSEYDRLIKQALASGKLNLNEKDQNKGKRKIELSEEHKEYIVNNCKSMTIIEITRELFSNQSLMVGHAETRAVLEYYKSLPPNVTNSSQDSKVGNDLEDYKPPKTLQQAFVKVNEYSQNGITQEQFKQNTKIHECLRTLIKFCHVYRYIDAMEKMVDPREKKLFESSFVRFVWDKPDLTEEEIDMYLNLCGDIVDLARLKTELSLHSEWLKQQSDDSDGKKLSLGLVESIGKVREDIDANQKRQVRLFENLQGKRSERISSIVKSNASILQLVEAWREEKTRKRVLQLAKQKKNAVKDEINKIDTMDEFTAQIFGLNKESFEP
jgi:hypothetical protein